jgi:hypothetical protein
MLFGQLRRAKARFAWRYRGNAAINGRSSTLVQAATELHFLTLSFGTTSAVRNVQFLAKKKILHRERL